MLFKCKRNITPFHNDIFSKDILLVSFVFLFQLCFIHAIQKGSLKPAMVDWHTGWTVDLEI